MIEISNINKWYDDFNVLTDVDEVIEKGRSVVICKPGGSGKSALLRCFNGLDPSRRVK